MCCETIPTEAIKPTLILYLECVYINISILKLSKSKQTIISNWGKKRAKSFYNVCPKKERIIKTQINNPITRTEHGTV